MQSAGAPPPGQASEIIEIGLCPLDLRTLERIEKRSILVKPVQSEISEFCTSLTTLTPDMFSDAATLADAVRVLKNELRSKDRLADAIGWFGGRGALLPPLDKQWIAPLERPPEMDSPIEATERLGGLLRSYHRAA